MKKHLVTFLFILILSACGGSKNVKQGDDLKQADSPFQVKKLEPEARTLFQQAEKAYQSKNYDASAKLFHQVRTKFPKGRAAQVSTYRIASVYYQKEDYTSASREYDYFLRRYPGSDLAVDATYNYGASEHLQGHFQKSAQIMARLKDADILAQGVRRAELIYVLKGQNAESLNQHPEAILAYVAQYQLPNDEKKKLELETKIQSHLAEMKDKTELEKLAAAITEPITKDKIQKKIASISVPTYAESNEVPPPTVSTVAGEVAPGVPIPSTGEKFRIGVILPLSGKWEFYGKKALDAILLASQILEETSQTPIQIFAEDSESSPLIAEQAVENLFHKHRVIGIIGPFNMREAQAVADKCQQLGILNLSLSSKEGISKKGNFIFQNGLTPRVQLDNLVRYTIQEKGLKRFAILAPDNPFGKDMSFEFWDLVQQYGGQVVAYQMYPPNEKDFQAHTQELVGLANPRFRQLELSKLNEWIKTLKVQKGRENKIKLPPIIDFDALFVPDSTKALAQIVPSLAFYDVNNMSLLGTTEWNTEQLEQSIGKLIKAAYFPSGVGKEARNSKQREFFDKYLKSYGSQPDLLSSQAYEAMEVLNQVIGQSPTVQRTELVQNLMGLKNFETVLGQISFDANRVAIRKIPVLSINDSE